VDDGIHPLAQGPNGSGVGKIAGEDLFALPRCPQRDDIGEPQQLELSGEGAAQNASKVACGSGEQNSFRGHGWFAMLMIEALIYKTCDEFYHSVGSGRSW
jgi:hypothetical protein